MSLFGQLHRLASIARLVAEKTRCLFSPHPVHLSLALSSYLLIQIRVLLSLQPRQVFRCACFAFNKWPLFLLMLKVHKEENVFHHYSTCPCSEKVKIILAIFAICWNLKAHCLIYPSQLIFISNISRRVQYIFAFSFFLSFQEPHFFQVGHEYSRQAVPNGC